MPEGGSTPPEDWKETGSPESGAFWGGRADGCQGRDCQVKGIRRRAAPSVPGLFCERKRAAPEGASKQNSRLCPGIFLPEGGSTPPEDWKETGSPESGAFWGGRADGCQGRDCQVKGIRRRAAPSVPGLFCERKRAAPEGASKQNSRLCPGIFLPEGGSTPPEDWKETGSPESGAFWGGRADGRQGRNRQVKGIRRGLFRLSPAFSAPCLKIEDIGMREPPAVPGVLFWNGIRTGT